MLTREGKQARELKTQHAALGTASREWKSQKINLSRGVSFIKLRLKKIESLVYKIALKQRIIQSLITSYKQYKQ